MTIEGVGPQLARAALGTDPRGRLVFEDLPSALQNAEDSTQAADKERTNPRGRVFERPATDTERALLDHLGYAVPDVLVTVVKWLTPGCRHRSWPQLEAST